MFSIFLNLFGRNSDNPSVTESDVGVNPVEGINESFEAINSSQENREPEGLEECEEFFDCQESLTSQSKTVSYVLKPLLYTAKYGAKALSATTVVVSYALNGTSYVIAGISYIPHGASKVLEKCKGEDKDTVGYKITASSQNLLNITSGAIYAVSYLPYGAAVILNGVSDVTGSVDSYLSTEKIEQVCTQSNLFVGNLSSKLQGIKTENFSQALAIAS